MAGATEVITTAVEVMAAAAEGSWRPRRLCVRLPCQRLQLQLPKCCLRLARLSVAAESEAVAVVKLVVASAEVAF